MAREKVGQASFQPPSPQRSNSICVCLGVKGVGEESKEVAVGDGAGGAQSLAVCLSVCLPCTHALTSLYTSGNRHSCYYISQWNGSSSAVSAKAIS